jgi:hypothetical protein
MMLLLEEIWYVGKIFLITAVFVSGFFLIVITYSAAKRCGMPGFWTRMPKREKGWFTPFAGLRTRFDAFGHKDFYFPVKVYGRRTSYVIARIMAMYLDYFTLSEARTWSVIYGSRK